MNISKKMDTLILRQKPLFKIELQKDGFIATNEADSNDNGIYLFEKIESISLHEKRVNWFVSAFSYVFGFLIGGGSGGIHKERNQLKISYDNVDRQIMMDNCDMNLAERVVQKIKFKMPR